MNKYEERVKKRAYEFARDKYKQSFYQVQAGPPMPFSKFNEDDPFVKKAIVLISESYIQAARLSVQREAEAAKDFHFAGWTNRAAYDHPADAARQGQLEYMLEQNGLIPPQTETI